MMSGLSGFCGGPVSPALRPMPGVQRRPLFHFPIRALYIKHLQAYNTAGQLLSFCCSQSSAIICDHLDLDHPRGVRAHGLGADALEALAFTAKDALLVVDDFVPTGG